MSEPDDPITPRRAARILGCHVATVYRYLLGDPGKGRPPKLRSWLRAGTRYVVSEAEVRALLVPRFPDQPPPPEPQAQRDKRHRRAEAKLSALGYEL